MPVKPGESSLLVDVVMVASNCARALELCLKRLPRRGVRSVVVVDNASTDNTGQVARDHGAVVLRSTHGGFGVACRRALRHLDALPVPPQVVVFVDPLGPEDPAEIERLLSPFRHENAELVLAKDPEAAPKTALVDKAMLGLIGVIYGHDFSEFSSMRAVQYAALVALGLGAEGESWNIEMMVKAVRLGLHIVEVPVSRREDIPVPRKPRSKATGRKLLRILRHSTAR